MSTSVASSSSQAQLLLGRSCRWCSTASARSRRSARSECPASKRYLHSVVFVRVNNPSAVHHHVPMQEQPAPCSFRECPSQPT